MIDASLFHKSHPSYDPRLRSNKPTHANSTIYELGFWTCSDNGFSTLGNIIQGDIDLLKY
jgi:hypothetical protein